MVARDGQRRRIGATVRELRRARDWSQAELAGRLGVSQGQLSQKERGRSPFTAEQFLQLLQLFNVSASLFQAELHPDAEHRRLQNALARLGASHLIESDDVVPEGGDALASSVVASALAEGDPRLVTALAPVLAAQADRTNLRRLDLDLVRSGLENRLRWVAESTLGALRGELEGPLERNVARRYRRATVVLDAFLEGVPAIADDAGRDILDPAIRSPQSVAEVWEAASHVARHWRIVTSIQPEDFASALRSARAR